MEQVRFQRAMEVCVCSANLFRPAMRNLVERALAFVDKLNRKRFGERIVETFRASGASKNGAREGRPTDLNANPGSYHKVENSEFPGRRRGENRPALLNEVRNYYASGDPDTVPAEGVTALQFD